MADKKDYKYYLGYTINNKVANEIAKYVVLPLLAYTLATGTHDVVKEMNKIQFNKEFSEAVKKYGDTDGIEGISHQEREQFYKKVFYPYDKIHIKNDYLSNRGKIRILKEYSEQQDLQKLVN